MRTYTLKISPHQLRTVSNSLLRSQVDTTILFHSVSPISCCEVRTSCSPFRLTCQVDRLPNSNRSLKSCYQQVLTLSLRFTASQSGERSKSIPFNSTAIPYERYHKGCHRPFKQIGETGINTSLSRRGTLRRRISFFRYHLCFPPTFVHSQSF